MAAQQGDREREAKITSSGLPLHSTTFVTPMEVLHISTSPCPIKAAYSGNLFDFGDFLDLAALPLCSEKNLFGFGNIFGFEGNFSFLRKHMGSRANGGRRGEGKGREACTCSSSSSSSSSTTQGKVNLGELLCNN